jgi:Family of unknown function (DUF6288)/HEAT repeats
MNGKQGSYMSRIVVLLSIMICAALPTLSMEGGYDRLYAKGEDTVLLNLGPTGLWGYGPKGVHHRSEGKDPNFIVVQRAEPGSPAYGLILPHDVITGANGKAFPEGEDARMYLAYAIVDSEAKDGKLHLQITRGGTPITVVLRLARIPDYSPTWPFDCERTDTMLIDACDFLAREQMPAGDVVADDGYIGPVQAGLLWLAMGEPRYLENARRAAYWFVDFARSKRSESCWNWPLGYGGMLLAEYYQMTGDQGILPGLELVVARISAGQLPSGGWSHKPYDGCGAGYGEVNNVGMVCYMTLLLAKESGAKVDEVALLRAVKYYDKYAPTLSSQYGDHKWSDREGYGSANGKIGGLAVAHRLNQRSAEGAAYALKAARSIDSIETGHTGHFFNFMWTPIAASDAPAREYRQAMDQIGWYYALSRTWRGGFFCQPFPRGSKYSIEGGQQMTTGGFGLSLAVARRHLRILGAPRSVFVQELPAELDAARKLHQSNQWDKAIAAVDAFLKQGGFDAETVRLANELRDKARYVKEDIRLAYDKLEKLGQGGVLQSRAYEVAQMMKPLRALLGQDDARLATIESGLPGKSQPIWQHGEDYHQAFRTLRTLSTYNWFVYAGLLQRELPDFAVPAGAPEWITLAQADPEKGTWKSELVTSPAEVPQKWNGLAFGDNQWKGLEGKSRRPSTGGFQLVRVPFEVDVKCQNVKQLRIYLASGKTALSPGSEAYLNGERILTAFNGVDNRTTVELADQAPKLLQQGRNVLAFITTNRGDIPNVSLQAVLKNTPAPFTWTAEPGRDAEIRKLVARRQTPQPYYQAEKDARTVDELMQAFSAEPVFMPDVAYAIDRLNKLLPEFSQKARYVEELLKSTCWGARWAGISLVCEAMPPPMDEKSMKRLPESEQAKVKEAAAAARTGAEKFNARIVELLDDSHPLVRCQAATAAGLYGASAKAGIPALTKLVGDLDGQDWVIRGAALEALRSMLLEEADLQSIMRTALKDPNTTVRRAALDGTLTSKDKAKKKKAIQTYKNEMINQVFDAPHGMWTSGWRGLMANGVLKELSKEDIRPSLPRFFESLNLHRGDQLKGTMAIIASFGEEVRPKLEALTKDKDQTVRCNALETLQMIVLQGNRSPELIELLKRELSIIMKSEDLERASWAEKLVKALEEKPKTVDTTPVDDSLPVPMSDDAGETPL